MQWKDGANCAVLLTFDFDGETMWESRVQQGLGDFDTPPIQSMGEYGGAAGMPRILDFLEEYDIPAGFFVPGKTVERYPELIQRVDADGHELGAHGHTHINPVSMSDEDELEEFRKSRAAFEDVVGEMPVGFRSPAADMGSRTLNRLIDMGMEYDSTLMGSDVPYFVEAAEGDIVEIPWFWSQDDAPHFNFNMYPLVSYQSGMSSPSDVLSIWKTEFDGCYEEGLLFHLVMHPQIIGRPHRMKMLERLVQHIKGHSDVWFARPKDIARYWRENVPEHERDVRTV
jgi:peptidoglycan/xylan/chitin deacetylase (PgdA/CDA1 family)